MNLYMIIRVYKALYSAFVLVCMGHCLGVGSEVYNDLTACIMVSRR